MKKYLSVVLFFGLLLTPVVSGIAGPVDAGLHLIISSPQGDMKSVSKTGMGLGGKFLYGFDLMPWFALRGDLGYLSYDSQQRMVNLGGYPIYETVRREGFQLALGPQITYSTDILKFYLSPMVGYSYFQTVISLPELAYYYGYYASETKDSYGCFAYTIGGGFMFDIGLGPWIDLGLKFNHLIDGVRRKEKGRKIVTDGSDITVTLGVVFYSDVQ